MLGMVDVQGEESIHAVDTDQGERNDDGDNAIESEDPKT
jgi:hypothetical protein